MIRQLRLTIINAFLAVVLTFSAGAAYAAETVLFIGNSFTYGSGSPVWKYRANSVTDLNGGGVGGVPALFKVFTEQAGLEFDVSLETVGGQGLDHHYAEKRALIDKPWDHVVMHGFSTLDRDKPGDGTLLVTSAGQVADMLHARNPRVNILLTATWSRADQTYREGGHWFGQPIEAMGRDLRRAYDAADAASPYIDGVVPVGDAWNRAFAVGFADPNPYDGVSYEQVNLWTFDSYHASAFGYYLEALMVFGKLTGKDPLSLGPQEVAARELGFTRTHTTMLQQIAHDELAAMAGAAGERG